MNAILKAIIVSAAIFLLVIILVGNMSDAIVIKHEETINSSIDELKSHLTELDKFSQWYPNADTVYVDSKEADVWLIESVVKDKPVTPSIRVNAEENSVNYKMWTGGYTSRTNMTLTSLGDSTRLSSRTVIGGRNVLLSGLNRINAPSRKRKVKDGFLYLKSVIEDKNSVLLD